MDNDLIRQGLDRLRACLPSGWRAELAAADLNGADRGPDASLSIAAPDQRRARLVIEAKRRIEPRDALVMRARVAGALGIPWLVISPFLSRGTRERLRDADVNWLDLTGNVRLVLPEPGLFIETTGSEQRPEGWRRPARTLKGRSAGRVVRAMLRAKAPAGVRELAEQARVDAGYVSRLLELLDEAALIERGPRGRLVSVDRVRLVRRWAEDAPLRARGESATFLEPRGLSSLMERLRATPLRYAVTGSLAAQRWAPVAAPRLAQIYVGGDVSEAAAQLELRPAESGANVQLIRPQDEEVIEAARPGDDGLLYARPAQVAADLLTSPGRGPAEGEALLQWMAEREDTWSG